MPDTPLMFSSIYLILSSDLTNFSSFTILFRARKRKMTATIGNAIGHTSIGCCTAKMI